MNETESRTSEPGWSPREVWRTRVRDHVDSPRLPVIDLSLARSGATWMDHLAAQLDWAASEFGFFYVIGHGVDQRTIDHLVWLSRRFFNWPLQRKLELHMKLGGRAWRGYFPVGGELTSGRPDLKEGLYLGEELVEGDARGANGWPLHGRNLVPDIEGFEWVLQRYQSALTRLGQDLMSLFSRGLGLGDDYFRTRYTATPTTLFRIFNYPANQGGGGGERSSESFGVGEHTDYGLLTLLYQDDAGGLEVRHDDDWVAVPYLPGTLVVNIGDMFERLTAGRYTSALHRVINRSGRARMSMPFFFDPAFDAALEPIPGLTAPARAPRRERWDGLDLTGLEGTYGEYLMDKVSRVFPDLSPALGRGVTGLNPRL